MKKLILNLTLIAFLATALGAYAAPVTNAQIKALIRKYKAKDYVGCVQDSQTLLKKDPSNAAVHYYQGLSLYQLGRTDKAIIAFNAVISLNSNIAITIKIAVHKWLNQNLFEQIKNFIVVFGYEKI